MVPGLAFLTTGREGEFAGERLLSRLEILEAAAEHPELLTALGKLNAAAAEAPPAMAAEGHVETKPGDEPETSPSRAPVRAAPDAPRPNGLAPAPSAGAPERRAGPAEPSARPAWRQDPALIARVTAIMDLLFTDSPLRRSREPVLAALYSGDYAPVAAHLRLIVDDQAEHGRWWLGDVVPAPLSFLYRWLSPTGWGISALAERLAAAPPSPPVAELRARVSDFGTRAAELEAASGAPSERARALRELVSEHADWLAERVRLGELARGYAISQLGSLGTVLEKSAPNLYRGFGMVRQAPMTYANRL